MSKANKLGEGSSRLISPTLTAEKEVGDPAADMSGTLPFFTFFRIFNVALMIFFCSFSCSITSRLASCGAARRKRRRVSERGD
jgi:hypothetical protein